MIIRRFEDIESWQMGRELCRQVYEVTLTPGLRRDFSLKDQMLRSAGSIMDNIAEGFDAGSNREFVRFLQYSKRSCSELQSQFYRALDQQYVTQETFACLYELIGRTRDRIGGFLQYLINNLDHRNIGDPR